MIVNKIPAPAIEARVREQIKQTSSPVDTDVEFSLLVSLDAVSETSEVFNPVPQCRERVEYSLVPMIFRHNVVRKVLRLINRAYRISSANPT